MKFGWESQKEKIKKYIKTSPRKKLEWLQSMHEFLIATATPQRRRLFWRLRGIK